MPVQQLDLENCAQRFLPVIPDAPVADQLSLTFAHHLGIHPSLQNVHRSLYKVVILIEMSLMADMEERA